MTLPSASESASPSASKIASRLRAAPAIAATLAFAAVGGWTFAWLHMPLAWLIGAMLITTIAALAGAPLHGPGRFRNIMVAVLGIMLGSAFTPDVLDTVPQWAGSLGALVVFIVIVVACVATYLTRVAGFDPITGYFSASPGGLATMVVYGAEMGGDERSIALVHSLRIMITVLVIPFWFRFVHGYVPGDIDALGTVGDIAGRDMLILASCALGYPLARALRLPAAQMIGPMIASAGVHMAGVTEAKPPNEIVNLAQVVIGAGIGCRFVGIRVMHVLRTVLTAATTTLFMLGLAVVFALTLERLTGLPFEALWLAFSPGGLAEMTLISLAMGIDTAFVSTHHLLRVMFMVFSAPLVFKLLEKYFRPGGDADADAGDGGDGGDGAQPPR